MPVFEAMANKTLQEFSAPTTANIRTRLVVDVREEGFKLKPDLINIVQATSFVGKHMNMQMPISNTSLRSIAHSPSMELKEMPYYSASFHSHSWEGRSNGSTPTERKTLHGISAPLLS
jgi:hypothetical protein